MAGGGGTASFALFATNWRADETKIRLHATGAEFITTARCGRRAGRGYNVQIEAADAISNLYAAAAGGSVCGPTGMVTVRPFGGHVQLHRERHQRYGWARGFA
jgi:hypothetical protein